MKIIYVITKANPIGGAQVHVRDLAIKAKQDGNEIFVICGENGKLINDLIQYNIECFVISNLVRDINPLKDLAAIFQITRILTKVSPDIVALHSSKAGIVGRIACRICRIPVVFTAHGWAFADGVDEINRQLYVLIERFFAGITDKVITVSIQDKELALKYGVASHAKQIVIHNGVKRSEFNTTECNRQSPVKLIMVARFSKQKDHFTLLQALRGLTSLSWELDLVGGGELCAEVKAVASEFNLTEKINFLGERDDVDQLLANSDIFLLISNWEGYPLSILEAKCCGLPIVASNVGGIRESVQDGINGYLVEQSDYHELENRLRELILSPEKREEFGGFNQHEFSQKHTLDEMYRKTITVYKQTVNNKKTKYTNRSIQEREQIQVRTEMES